jgi:hypothetical protein
MKELLEYVETELKGLDRGFVATPDSREALAAFARANGGSSDMLLMQMAIQYGASLVLNNVKDMLQED